MGHAKANVLASMHAAGEARLARLLQVPQDSSHVDAVA